MTPEYSKDISAAAYLLPVGWVVAFALRRVGADDTEFTAFHLRQAFGLSLLELLCYFALCKGVDNVVVNSLLSMIFFYFSYVGFRGVRKGLLRYQPFLGKCYDRWFTFIR